MAADQRGLGAETYDTGRAQEPTDPRPCLTKWTHPLIIKYRRGDLEKVENYDVGGLLPIHLGDRFGRYKVIHKLGDGPISTVWLCRDVESDKPQYYAAKVCRADVPDSNLELIGYERVRDRICNDDGLVVPLQSFLINGPNGSNKVFVYPVLVPNLKHMFSLRIDPECEKTLRQMCHQITRGLAILHSCNICHGDLYIRNVLVEMSGLSELNEEDLVSKLGQPRCTSIRKVVKLEGRVDPVHYYHDYDYAPQYAVSQACWGEAIRCRLSPTGRAFLTGSRMSYDLNCQFTQPKTKLASSSPELLLHGTFGVKSDIWALGLTIFDMRTGKRLFRRAHTKDEQLFSIFMMLGMPPLSLWTAWEARSRFFTDQELVQDVGAQLAIHEGVGELRGHNARSIRERIETCVPHEDQRIPTHLRRLASEEVDLLTDLLQKIFEWDPEKRPTAAQISHHPWFSYTSST